MQLQELPLLACVLYTVHTFSILLGKRQCLGNEEELWSERRESFYYSFKDRGKSISIYRDSLMHNWFANFVYWIYITKWGFSFLFSSLCKSPVAQTLGCVAPSGVRWRKCPLRHCKLNSPCFCHAWVVGVKLLQWKQLKNIFQIILKGNLRLSNWKMHILLIKRFHLYKFILWIYLYMCTNV